MECVESMKLEKYLSQAKGLVFDFDGTLFDTMPTYYESWSRTCNEVGLSFPIARFYSYAGMSVVHIFDILIQEQLPSDTDITAIHCEERKKFHHAQIMKEDENNIVDGEGKSRNPPIHVVLDIVKKYHNRIPIAIASSGWKDHITSTLEKHNLIHYFNIIITAEDDEIKHGKPHPDLYIVAAQKIGVNPDCCIGFEDADLGMEAIEKAGYLYACDVRLMDDYPRNLEKRILQQGDNKDEVIGDAGIDEEEEEVAETEVVVDEERVVDHNIGLVAHLNQEDMEQAYDSTGNNESENTVDNDEEEEPEAEIIANEKMVVDDSSVVNAHIDQLEEELDASAFEKVHVLEEKIDTIEKQDNEEPDQGEKKHDVEENIENNKVHNIHERNDAHDVEDEITNKQYIAKNENHHDDGHDSKEEESQIIEKVECNANDKKDVNEATREGVEVEIEKEAALTEDEQRNESMNGQILNEGNSEGNSAPTPIWSISNDNLTSTVITTTSPSPATAAIMLINSVSQDGSVQPLTNYPSNDDENFERARELALVEATMKDKEEFFAEDLPLSQKELLQSILLAEDAANNGAEEFSTKDKIHYLDKVHITLSDDELKGYDGGDVRAGGETTVPINSMGQKAWRFISGLKERRPGSAKSVSSRNIETTGSSGGDLISPTTSNLSEE